MAIHRFFNQQIVIQRLKTDSGDKQSFQSTATVDGHIQELDERLRQRLGIVGEKAFEAWFPEDCIIREGDKVVDENDVVYEVREAIVKTYGINQHTQCVLVRSD